MSFILKKNQNLMKVGLMVVFVLEPEFLNYIKGDQTFLEEPLEKACQKNNNAFIIKGFWQCMDAKETKLSRKFLRKKKLLSKKILIIGGTSFMVTTAKKCLIKMASSKHLLANLQN